jgi:hypothetical protein
MAMTSSKLVSTSNVILLVGLLTAGTSVMGYSATRRNDSVLVNSPQGQAPQRPPAEKSSLRPDGVPSAKNRGPVIVQIVVVDPQGRSLSGVDVSVTIGNARPAEGQEDAVDRAVSDRDGKVRVEIARERVDGKVAGAVIWGYQPGRGVARAATSSLQVTSSPPVVRLTLEEPLKRTIMVVGPDDQPVKGVRLSPRSLRRSNSNFPMQLPEELRARLAVSTDAKGEATLAYLPRGLEPLTAEVSGPGIAKHTIPLIDRAQRPTLRIGRTGRLVGVVRGESGEPLAGIPVAVWVKPSGTLPVGISDVNSPPEKIRFDSEPLATGAQGTFQTAPALLSGSIYRVSIRPSGFAPFISDWVTLGGEHTTIPPIRLQSLRKLTGGVHDRAGRPVSGARVFLPSFGPSTATDDRGHFELRDALPDKTFVLVQHPAFRFQGWPVDPATQAGELRLTLVRTSEAPARAMTVLEEPIPLHEARALAQRVLEPYLQDLPEKINEGATRAAIEALSTFDLDRALDLFKKGLVTDPRYANGLRIALAEKLGKKDPSAAVALIEAIADPVVRIRGLLALANSLPASEREHKRLLLETVVPMLRGLVADTAVKLPLIASIAEAWLDLGQTEKARPLLQDGVKLFDTLPQTTSSGNSFLAQLVRLEPEPALARIRKIPTIQRFLSFADVAPQLTIDDPAEAEQFYNLWAARQTGTIYGTIRLCRRLARADPSRARRVAGSLVGPGERVCAWAFVALGLAEKDQAGAHEALDHAIEEIDRLRDLGPSVEPGIVFNEVRVMYPTNPAALILPVVERIAPDRLAEVFWRAVALHPRIDIDRDDLLRSSYLGIECMLLARYDRQVAAVLFERMDSYLRSLVTRKSDSGEFTSSVIAGKACLNPQEAVALLEALPEPRGPFTVPFMVRANLAEALGQPPEERWKSRWRHISGVLPLED